MYQLYQAKICLNLISDHSHMTDMIACVTVPGSHRGLIMISSDVQDISQAKLLQKLLPAVASFSSGLMKDTTSTFQKNAVKDYSKHIFGKRKRSSFKVKPGLVYLMASFFHNSTLQAEHVQSRNIEPIIGEEADLVSTLTTWFFSNSFIYDPLFSPKVVTEVELERKSIIHQHGNAGSRHFFQTRAYMTLVWGILLCMVS